MNRDLELLIRLNDLELLIKEVEEAASQEVEKDLGFKVTKRDELFAIRQKIRDAIRRDTLDRFDRAWQRYGRALAPVSNGVCCGCFERLPTSLTPTTEADAQTKTCPYCARILYWPLQE